MLLSSGIMSGVGAIMGLAYLTDASDLRTYGLLGIMQFVFFLGTAVAWLVWQHGAHSRLHAASIPGLTITPRWAVGWWFVPIANLARPPRVMEELWKASDPSRGDGWAGSTAPWFLWVWWVTFLGGNLIARVSLNVDSREVYFALGLLSDSVTVVAAVFAIRLVRSIEGRMMKGVA